MAGAYLPFYFIFFHSSFFPSDIYVSTDCDISCLPKTFNYAMPDNGMPPIRLMREILLKDKEKWVDALT